MSPYLGWCRSGSAALEILGEMLVLRSEEVSWGPQEDGLKRGSYFRCRRRVTRQYCQ